MNNNYFSPINGSELKPTERPGIMYSEHDGMYYNVEQGNINPLNNLINIYFLCYTSVIKEGYQ